MTGSGATGKRPADKQTAGKRALTRERLLTKALQIIDADGLDALTIRSLGSSLGVSQTAVYRHVPSKAALLDGVVESLWRSAIDLDTIPPDMDWRQALEHMMVGAYRALAEHPNALPLMATHPMNTTGAFDLTENWLNELTVRGMDVGETTVNLFNSLAIYTTGWLIAMNVPAVGGDEPNTAVYRQSMEGSPLMRRFLSPLTGRSNDEENYRQGLHVLIYGWGQVGSDISDSPNAADRQSTPFERSVLDADNEPTSESMTFRQMGQYIDNI